MALNPKITIVRVSAVPFLGFYYFVSSSSGQTIGKLIGGGRSTKKYSRKGKLSEKNFMHDN